MIEKAIFSRHFRFLFLKMINEKIDLEIIDLEVFLLTCTMIYKAFDPSVVSHGLNRYCFSLFFRRHFLLLWTILKRLDTRSLKKKQRVGDEDICIIERVQSSKS